MKDMDGPEIQSPNVEIKPELSQPRLYHGNIAEIIAPNPPNIPVNEGIHLDVTGSHDSADSPREVLTRFLLSEGVAKVIAEGGVLPEDFWSNTRIEEGNQVSVYSRRPLSDESWRKPVNTAGQKNTAFNEFPYQEKLEKVFAKYMPKWEELAGKMVLFPEGVQGTDLAKEGGEGPLLWENPKFKVELIRKGHVQGVHIIVHPKEGFARQWQTVRETQNNADNEEMVQEYIQSTLEATAIALTIRQLLGDTGAIHNSGNWASGLKFIEEGGTLSHEGMTETPKLEKRVHAVRVDAGNPQSPYMLIGGERVYIPTIPEKVAKDRREAALQQGQTSEQVAALDDIIGNWQKIKKVSFGTGMHVHIYIPKDGMPISLPSMSRGEASERKQKALEQGKPAEEYDTIISQWDAIGETSPEDIEEVRKKLEDGKISDTLTRRCQGSLINQNQPKVQI